MLAMKLLGRIVLPLALLGVLLAGCQHGHEMAERREVPELVAIGAWNIYWLGPSERTPREKRSPEDFATYILQAGVSILALQEIGDSPGPGVRNHTLDATFKAIAQRGAGDWDYRLFDTTQSGRNQLTGIAWDRRVVQAVGEPFDLGTPVGVRTEHDATLWDRRPQAMKFSLGSGKTDLVIIPVHMKANRPGMTHAAHRGLETDELVGRLQAVQKHFADLDIIILGDFNTLQGNERTVQKLQSAGWRDLNAKDLGTYKGRNPFDRAFVPATQPEFTDHFVVHKPRDMGEVEFEQRLSDHYMIVTKMRVIADDD